MATRSLRELMDEMAATLRNVYEPLAATNWAVQVHARRNFNPTPPSIDIYEADPFRVESQAGFGDNGAYVFVVRARINTGDDEGQDVLVEFKDDESALSVANALADDQTLNGFASSVHVSNPTGNRIHDDLGGQLFLGCEWTVSILRVTS